MKAILVSVNYSDLLAITLPYNRHHFDQVWIVTDSKSFESVVRVVTELPARLCSGVTVLRTDLFYANGAQFNKWAALEWGLDQMGRKGWLCVMDADVLWPKALQIEETTDGCLFIGRVKGACGIALWPGQLCTPMRRMCSIHEGVQAANEPGSERWWNRFPIHRNINEWAGYSQIFHASDPVLGPAPWHQVDWTHAGGADSFFQAKWPDGRKIRPPFECLHIGEAGQNWFGRATPLADGTVLPGSDERREMSGQKIWAARRANRAAGRDQFDGEKIG